MTWPAADRWRAPIGDWPPLWSSSWGSDSDGLWADLVIGGVAQRFRWIEPSGPEGFRMGDPGKQLHKVVEAGFWLADTPCTQAFWVQGADGQANPSQFQHRDEAGQWPVEQVSWDDVQRWLERLAQLCPATVGLADLPTEVQWEYACRAGTTTDFWWGNGRDPHPQWANVDLYGDRERDGSKGATTPVKRYAPNPWGLHDMHGNVWEWCENVWRDRLDEDGEGVSSERAIRGGSWIGYAFNARSAYRLGMPRDSRDQRIGFRFSLRSPSQAQVSGPEGQAR